MRGGHLKIAIIGAGIIGLSCAWELLKRGAHVTLFEKHWPPVGASWAAAGMLAPSYEAGFESEGHAALFQLCSDSAKLWKTFAAVLEAETGMKVGYCAGPSLALAMDTEEAERLYVLEDTLADTGLVTERLHRSDVLQTERSVSPDFSAALGLASDGWVDPRRTVLALRAIVEKLGGGFELVPSGVLASDLAGQYDVCLETSGVAGGKNVTPVKGVMLAFRRADLPLDHVVRCNAEYAVPRGDQVLVGATVGEVPDPRSYLLSRAVRFLPRLRSAALLDQWTGWRPATTDLAPIFGRTGIDGSYVANGHYRNGILLAPVTAKIMADMMLDGVVSELAAHFAPARFGATG